MKRFLIEKNAWFPNKRMSVYWVSHNWCHTHPCRITQKRRDLHSWIFHIYILSSLRCKVSCNPAGGTSSSSAFPSWLWTRTLECSKYAYIRTWVEPSFPSIPWQLSANFRLKIRATAQRLQLCPEHLEAGSTPYLRFAGSICWTAIVFKNCPRHVRQKFDLI